MLDRTLNAAIPMAAKEKTFYSALGQRIAERRKALGITQVQLAETLGIAQQTMAHYEGGVSRIAVETLTLLADALGASVEDFIGTQTRRSASKRGPVPKLQQQQLEQLSRLPKTQQRLVSQLIDTVLQQHGS